MKSKFDKNISGIAWNGCVVTDDVFPVLLAEQGLEFKACIDTDASVEPSEPPAKRPCLIKNKLPETSQEANEKLERTPTRVITYHCSNCVFTTKKLSMMSNHLRIHGNIGAVVCPNCLTKYRSLSGYRRHLSVCPCLESQIEDDYVGNSVENEASIMLNDDERPSNYMYGLALQLLGKHRCSETVLNVVFSHISEMLSSPDFDLEKVKSACDSLSTQHKRLNSITQMFNVPSIQSYNEVYKASVIDFDELISFILRSPEINAWTSNDDKSVHFDIALYCDDLGVTNPIGKSRSKHKLWVLYFKLLNIPERYRGRISSIFPLIVADNKAIKDREFSHQFMANFIQKLKNLKDGVKMRVEGVDRLVYVDVQYFVGDSLAANGIAGFKEGFSGKTLRCCRMCTSTYEEMKTLKSHDQCSLRNLTEHQTRCQELNSGLTKATRKHWSKLYGIQDESLLSQIPQFDVTKQVIFDFMHDLLEGLIPHQFELLLAHLTEKYGLSIKYLNQWIRSFKYPAHIERPNVISDSIQLKGRFGSGQMLSLCYVFLYFLNDHFVDFDDHIECFHYLLRILLMFMSPVVSSSYHEDLRCLIENHHTQFMMLYPSHFIPKLHFLKHYVYQAERFGSPRYQMCMGYERKHQVIKNFRHFNFKNIPLTACRHLLNNTICTFFNSEGNVKTDIYSELDEISTRDNAIVKLKANGVTYGIGDVITLYQAGALTFAIINKIINSESERRLSITRLKVNSYMFVFQCSRPSVEEELVNPDDLLFPWTTLCRRKGDDYQIMPLALPNTSVNLNVT